MEGTLNQSREVKELLDILENESVAEDFIDDGDEGNQTSDFLFKLRVKSIEES